MLNSYGPLHLSTTFMSFHLILKMIPHSQCAATCNEMEEQFLESFMRNIVNKAAFVSVPVYFEVPARGHT